MSAPVIVLLVATIGAAVWAAWARRLDRIDEYHLLHGPNDGCVECENK